MEASTSSSSLEETKDAAPAPPAPALAEPVFAQPALPPFAPPAPQPLSRTDSLGVPLEAAAEAAHRARDGLMAALGGRPAVQFPTGKSRLGGAGGGGAAKRSRLGGGAPAAPPPHSTGIVGAPVMAVKPPPAQAEVAELPPLAQSEVAKSAPSI